MFLNNSGRFVQGYVVLSIQLAVALEVLVFHPYLETLNAYELEFNHLTGWPLYLLTMYYYYKATNLPPGHVRSNWDVYSRGTRVGSVVCVKCKQTKPMRTSHCKKCNTCVARRDHHCIFTNNCVGYSNFRPFIMFLIFGLLGCLHFVLRGAQWGIEWYWGNALESYSTLFAVFVIIHVYNMMGFLGLLLHILQKTMRNAIRNVSTLDGWVEKSLCGSGESNFFHLGLVQNLVIAFGDNPIFWFSSSPPTRFGVPLGPDFPVQPE